MRIAFLCITLGIEKKGGELYVHQLANALAGRGHEVLVLSAGPAPDGARYQHRQIPVPFRLHRLYTGPLRLSWGAAKERAAQAANRAAHLAFLAAALPLLLRARPQILVPLLMDPELPFAKGLRRSIGCRLVSIGHGGAGNDAAALGGVDAFIATSPRQAAWARYFEQARVALIPVGVDLARFSPDGPKAPLALPRPIALQVGSLLPVKRPFLSIEAMARREEGSLLFIGEGPLAAALDARGAALLDGRYLRLPGVPHADLASYYRAAEVLLFPSDQGETAGLVPLEAMACGVPVVASDDETRRWMLGGAAVLADPTNSLGFALAMEAALSSRDPKKLRAHAARFGWEEVVAQHEELYQGLFR